MKVPFDCSFIWLLCFLQSVSARQYPLAASSLPLRYPHRISRRTALSRSTSQNKSRRHGYPDSILLVRSAAKQKTAVKEADGATKGPPQISYADLGPIGRVVAGTVEVTVTTLLEYLTGFCGGYFLGTVTDVPRLLFRSSAADPATARTFLQETSGRFARLHGKSARWARTWGGISAAFGGFGCFVKVIRNGREDEWNTILSSMAAGAYFARAEGPQAMARSAILYGGFSYMLSGSFGKKKEPFDYQEQEIEF